MKRILLAILLFLLPAGLQAQMLAFNIEAPPELTVTVMSDGVLDFGNLMQNQGLVQIQLMDPDTEIISIEGDSRCSVNVNITSTDLQLNPDLLPYSLGAAYSNEGGNVDKTQAQNNIFSGNNTNSASTTFRLDGTRGQGGGPPCGGTAGPPGKGPPGQGPGSTTAYLYIFGDITVGNVRAGTYTGTINVNVSYD